MATIKKEFKEEIGVRSTRMKVKHAEDEGDTNIYNYLLYSLWKAISQPSTNYEREDIGGDIEY